MNPRQLSINAQLHKTQSQSSFKSFSTTIVAILATIVLSVQLTGCASSLGTPSHISGHVLDTITNEPIEGAYVSLMYESSGSVPYGHSARWCVATAGMVTGKDGAFQFPYESKYGGTAQWAYAVKSGYFFAGEGAPWDMRYETPYNKYNNWKAKLVKQGQEKLIKGNLYRNGSLKMPECNRPASREAILANLEFLKITLAEQIRISYLKSMIEINQRSMDRMLKATDDQPVQK